MFLQMHGDLVGLSSQRFWYFLFFQVFLVRTAKTVWAVWVTCVWMLDESLWSKRERVDLILY